MAGRHQQRSQGGAALLLFLILLVMGALTYIVNNLTPEAIEAERARKTGEALTLARDALIGYALNYRDAQAAKDPDSSGEDDRAMYGYLPLPDLGSSRNNNLDPACLDAASNPIEGCDANNFTGLTFDANGIGPTVVGRFPWRTLGTAPLRDGHGECLWLIVSSLHSRIQRATPPPILPPMNWDSLGQLDIVVANGTNALNSALVSAHSRPVAIIYAPGPSLPGQDRTPSTTDDVTQCGGNYNAANYLDPVVATALGGVTHYLAGTNSASGATGDSNPTNDPDTPKSMLTDGKVFATGGNYVPTACTGANCDLLVNDMGMRLTSDHLFGALRKNANFRTDINSLLDRISSCLRDEIAAGGSIANGKIMGANNNTCYGQDVPPLGYYPHWREMIHVAAPATVNAVPCAGALLFSGQRATGQVRITPTDKATPANYLEGSNLAEFTTATNNFTGPDLFDRISPTGQSASQDIVRCIPVGGSFTPVASPTLTSLGFGQLTAYDAATRTLTLGRANVTTGNGAPAGTLYGCAWIPEVRNLGNGLRTYFQFRFKIVGTNVGSNGFTFALADALNNTLLSCGAAGSHLGYSGVNGTTPAIAYPKIGIEFDQSRDANIPAAGSETSLTSGRNDPCGTSGCGGTAGYNSHAAILYWGNALPSGTITQPDFDDNVHGLPVGNPPPTNPPYPSSGIAFVDLRGKASEGGDSYLYHVRIDITPVRTSLTPAEDSYTTMQTRVWILADSPTVANQIADLRNTTRPVNSSSPKLEDTAKFYDLPVTGSFCDAATPCPSSQACGTGNVCYRPALQKLRLGFTNSQRTTDQEIRISDIFTTWLP